MKRNEGFTLIELLVTISAGALVTFAALSLLLLGVRVQHTTAREAEEQQTVRVAMALLEKMAGSGEFNAIRTTYNGWQLLDCADPEEPDEEDPVVFEYVNTKQTIYRGEATANEPVLTGLNNAGVTMEDNLLRLSFETTGGTSYVTRVYCRTADISDTTDSAVQDAGALSAEGKEEIPGATNRINFLETLAGEYNGGKNTGQIVGGDGSWEYYSEWYIEGYNNNGWDKDTPWCACFVSWAAVEAGLVPKESPLVFANVDTGMELFKKAGTDADPSNGKWVDAVPGVVPTPGDYIFFDWTGERKDPAHVGVVLDTQGDDVYTIEGNSSGRVAVRKYNIGDSVIMGYGVLPGF